MQDSEPNTLPVSYAGPRIYVPQRPSSFVSVFHRACVPPCLCSSMSVFHRACVPPCLCSSVPVLHRACVPPCLCSTLPVFLRVHRSRMCCSVIHESMRFIEATVFWRSMFHISAYYHVCVPVHLHLALPIFHDICLSSGLIPPCPSDSIPLLHRDS